jgi:hypothetical protein
LLHRIGGGSDQPGAGAELLAPGPPAEAVAQRFGGGDDQGLELRAKAGRVHTRHKYIILSPKEDTA